MRRSSRPSPAFAAARAVIPRGRGLTIGYTLGMKESITPAPKVKTGVSISKDLAEEADALARELRVTRSQLYSMALDEFIRRHESRVLLERLNAAYGEEPDAEEQRLLKSAKEYSRRLLEADER